MLKLQKDPFLGRYSWTVCNCIAVHVNFLEQQQFDYIRFSHHSYFSLSTAICMAHLVCATSIKWFASSDLTQPYVLPECMRDAKRMEFYLQTLWSAAEKSGRGRQSGKKERCTWPSRNQALVLGLIPEHYALHLNIMQLSWNTVGDLTELMYCHVLLTFCSVPTACSLVLCEIQWWKEKEHHCSMG